MARQNLGGGRCSRLRRRSQGVAQFIDQGIDGAMTESVPNSLKLTFFRLEKGLHHQLRGGLGPQVEQGVSRREHKRRLFPGQTFFKVRNAILAWLQGTSSRTGCVVDPPKTRVGPGWSSSPSM